MSIGCGLRRLYGENWILEQCINLFFPLLLLISDAGMECFHLFGGGAVNKQFDAFRSLTNLDSFFDNIDIYDTYERNESSIVEKPSDYQIDVAFDHKKNLLKKSMQLKLYREFKVGDANQKLPFPEESFNSIFSNIVYWLDDPQSVLKEMSRILLPGGKACLMLPNQTFPEFSFYNQLYVKAGNTKWKFLEKLDRGRFKDNIRQARSDREWESLFLKANLKVYEHETHLSKTAVQIWDIGLRPIFPVLKKMTDQISRDSYVQIKNEWVDLVQQFIEPLLEMDGELCQGAEPAFHCYILKK